MEKLNRITLSLDGFDSDKDTNFTIEYKFDMDNDWGKTVRSNGYISSESEKLGDKLFRMARYKAYEHMCDKAENAIHVLYIVHPSTLKALNVLNDIVVDKYLHDYESALNSLNASARFKDNSIASELPVWYDVRTCLKDEITEEDLYAFASGRYDYNVVKIIYDKENVEKENLTTEQISYKLSMKKDENLKDVQIVVESADKEFYDFDVWGLSKDEPMTNNLLSNYSIFK